MNKKIFENARFCPKGDIEANWNKAVGFVPLDKEIIIYKADAEHPVARFKVGDGKTVVQDLPFSGTDIEAIQKLINEKGELLIEYVDNAVAAIIEQLDQKLDKSGGLIGGDLSIQGNLNVAGTTTAKDTETIMVKDNTIVANSEGIELLEEAGFVVKTNITDAYGIMYDPSGDGVKIGLGAIDESGKFSYTEGEDQFLATRANTIVDGHTVVWDDENKTLVDSGVDHSEYVKSTDYATTEKAGVVKINNLTSAHGLTVADDGLLKIYQALPSNITGRNNEYRPITSDNMDYAWKVCATTNTETWTDDDKAAACETIGAVKRPAGITGLQTAITQNPQGGIESIALSSFANQALFGRIPRYQNPAYEGDVPADNMGMLVTNTPTKQYHCTNKKYVDEGFVAKDTVSSNGVYGKSVGNEYFYAISQGVTGDTVARRNAQGYLFATSNIKAGDNCLLNIKTATDNFVSKFTDTSGYNRLYGEGVGGNQMAISIQYPNYGFDANSANSRNGIPAYVNGNLGCSIPTSDYHTANKKYVDELVYMFGECIRTADLWTPVHKEYTTILDTDGRKWNCDAVGYSNTRTKKNKVEYTLISTQEITANADNVTISVPLIGVNYILGAKYRVATIAYSALPIIEDDEDMGNKEFQQSYFTLDGFTWDERTDIGNECTPLPFRGSGGFEVKVLTWTDNPAASITFKTIIAKVTKYEV
jgi:hypothetical protein